jgi:hypothetical protein
LDSSSGFYHDIPLKNSLKEMNEFYSDVCKEDMDNENTKSSSFIVVESWKNQATQLQLGSQSRWIEKSKEEP